MKDMQHNRIAIPYLAGRSEKLKDFHHNIP